jgi:peptidoglycan hydrolase CwlO-like protein
MGIKGEGYDETKTARVRKLQEMILRLTKNYKDRQMYENVKLAPQSQDLEDSIQVLQQGIVDGNKGEADIAAKEAEVAAFVQTLTKKETKAAEAAKAAAAKKAKAEAKKAAKKGGRRTVRKERRGRKTPRA